MQLYAKTTVQDETGKMLDTMEDIDNVLVARHEMLNRKQLLFIAFTQNRLLL